MRRNNMRPKREHATQNQQTYMVTTSTWGRRALFRNERWAQLLLDTLFHYRRSAYLLHEFVIMPDHVHVLLTPLGSLEKAVQFIKGGFSYRAKKELGSNMEVWQKGFQDRRIRDAADYDVHVTYVRENPVRKRLCEHVDEYPFSSARVGLKLDEVPQGLKPIALEAAVGAPEGAPFQNNSAVRVPQGTPLRIGTLVGTHEESPSQGKTPDSAAKAAAFQSTNKIT
jgi:putative transposase